MINISMPSVPKISIAACRINAKLNQREFASKIGV